MLIACSIFAFKSKKPIGKTVSLFIAALVFPVAGNLMIIASDFEWLSEIGCYFFFIGMNLIMAALVKFTIDYCEVTWHKKALLIITGSLLLADTISLLLNIAFHHCFTMVQIEAFGSIYYQFEAHIGQTIHRVIDYAILAGAMATFVWKSIITPKFYREKYVVILIAMIVAAVWQTVYIITKTPVDISMTAFGAFGLILYILTIHYRPLRLLDRMLAAIASKMPDALFFFDKGGHCIWANHKAYEMLGLDSRETDLVPNKLRDLIGEYEQHDFDVSDKIVSNGGDQLTSYVMERQEILDDRGRLVGSSLTVRDNTKEQQTLEKETYNATHDNLTKAYNRQGFDEAFDEVDFPKCFLVLVDLDSFKEANDKYGHNIGDQVLIKVVETIKKHFREDDFVCRIGGDEFAVIIPKADNETPKMVEERVELINEDLTSGEGGLPKISISAGGAFGKDAENAEELVNNADHAMYEIKFSGKRGFTMYKKR